MSESGVYGHCSFYQALENSSLNLLNCKPIPKSNDPFYDEQCTEPIPYVFTADDTFRLGIHFMKSY